MSRCRVSDPADLTHMLKIYIDEIMASTESNNMEESQRLTGSVPRKLP